MKTIRNIICIVAFAAFAAGCVTQTPPQAAVPQPTVPLAPVSVLSLPAPPATPIAVSPPTTPATHQMSPIAILNAALHVGMTTSEVLAATGMEPEDSSSTSTGSSTIEVWEYAGAIFLTFENGKLSSWTAPRF
ncbi:MAG TPA: hypothetical protein VIK35_00495 [Verrucomicrobiae bacterium]